MTRTLRRAGASGAWTRSPSCRICLSSTRGSSAKGSAWGPTNSLFSFPLHVPFSPTLHRRCMAGARLTLSSPVLPPTAQRQTGAGVQCLLVEWGQTTLWERPPGAAAPACSTYPCRGFLLHAGPSHLFPHPISGGKTIPPYVPSPKPRAGQLLSHGSRIPRTCSWHVGLPTASHAPAAPVSLPAAPMPPRRPGPHLDREWPLSWCMCGLYWARMVMVSHCCPMMSRACCSVALRRFMPLN